MLAGVKKNTYDNNNNNNNNNNKNKNNNNNNNNNNKNNNNINNNNNNNNNNISVYPSPSREGTLSHFLDLLNNVTISGRLLQLEASKASKNNKL